MGYMVELQPSIGPALVVGGGLIAARKVRGLLAAGFQVTVVAPEVAEEISGTDGVTVHQRPFEAGDVAGHAIVFACADARDVNAAVGEEAKAAGVPVVVADRQEESTAFTPAVHRDGPLTIAVSTGGSSPGLAGTIRDRLAAALGEGVGKEVEAAAKRRARARSG